MKYLLPAALLAVFLLVSCRKNDAPKTAVNELEPKNGLSRLQADSIASLAKAFPNGTQLSMALLRDSTAVFYGMIRQQDTLRYFNNADSVFEIGSLSKVFTSALLAHFAVTGKLSLDSPIQEHLDFPLHNDIELTFKQLANHTSGLPRVPTNMVWASILHPKNPYKNFDEEKLTGYLKDDMKLFDTPGANYTYSNIGAGILGFVLVRMENKSYEELLQAYITEPLGMTSTTTRREEVAKQLVVGLDKYGEPTPNWDLAALQGAGGILSTTRDLTKFGFANFEPEREAYALQREPTFTRNKTMKIGLGWHIMTGKPGRMRYWHNGGTGGYRSSMVLDVANKKGVILLSNVSAGHPKAKNIDELSFALMKSL